MNGGAIMAGTSLGSSEPGMQVVGGGDFDADGAANVLVAGPGGSLVAFTVANDRFTRGTSLGSFGATWSLAGTGDLDGNGTSDILLQTTVDSGAVIFSVNGGTVTAGTGLGTLGNARVVASGDYNGDGTSNLLTQSATGALYVFTMHNDGFSGGAFLGNPGPAWHAVDPTLAETPSPTLLPADVPEPLRTN